MSKPNSGGIIPRGFGEFSRVLTRGFGRFVQTFAFKQKKGKKFISKDFTIKVSLPIIKNLNLQKQIRFSVFKKLISTYFLKFSIKKSSDYNYQIKNSLLKKVNQVYPITLKINHTKLINTLNFLLEDDQD